MPGLDEPKLLARNVAAVRRLLSPITDRAAGNPVVSRLESGVGNCFPGLECDLRNLERRFLPFLEVEFVTFNVGQDVNRGQLILLVASIFRRVESALANG